MNPAIEELEDILDAIIRGIQEVLASGEILPPEFQNQVANEIYLLTQEIDELYAAQEAQPQQPPSQPGGAPTMPPTPAEQFLWILAGQKVDAFINYLATFPDPALNALLHNPDELDRVIYQLMQMMPPGEGEAPSVDGIQKAGINSSNIFGFAYNPKDGRLLVRFNEGGVYGYEGVPPGIFKMFQEGAIPARTNGQNRWGKWWRGKSPSLGSSFYSLIKSGPYPYQRLS
jgi:hypothetical protein